MSLPLRRRAALCGIAILLAPGTGAATGGAYAESAHGSRTSGVLRIPGERRGSCGQCHTSRASGSSPSGEGPGLHDARTPGAGSLGNGLCLECHVQPRPGASFRGGAAYDASAHAASPRVVWPERRRRARQEPGRCVACHDPHGLKDATGVVPSLLRARGERLCLGCHDGDAAKNVVSPFRRTYRHPLVSDVPAEAGSAGGGAGPSAAGMLAARGSGTCGGCHNPHVVRRDAALMRPPLAAGALAGVQRVRISNGPPGTPIGYTLVGPEDDMPAREYEVCLRCHSGFARRASRLVDVAALLNPQNASFHPVEERGRSRGVDRRAFSPGWSAESLVLCTDCHSSDTDETRGPHGSAYAHILKKPYAAATGPQLVRDGDLCFECHAFTTYAAAGAGQTASYSRFTGHPSHVARGSSCFACHDAHGSAELPALLALRAPGLTAYAGDDTGGRCTTTCHRQTAPTISYKVPRAR